MFARPKEGGVQPVTSSYNNRIQNLNSTYSTQKRQNSRGNQNSNIQSTPQQESPNKSIQNTYGKQGKLDSSQSSLHRIDRLEDVVNKLTNQYDALMPLLNLVENAPLLIKKENLIANLQKKFQQTEDRSLQNKQSLESVYGQVEQIKQDLQHQLNNEIRAFENKFHSQEQKMNDSLRQIQNNEAKLTKTVNKIEGKQREELQISLKKYDQRYSDLDNAMKQLTQDLQERLQALDIERQKMKRSTANRRDSSIGGKNSQIISQVENQVEKKIQDFSTQIKKQLDNLASDIGSIQCEAEIQNEHDKRNILNDQASEFPKDISLSQKMLKINHIEYQYIMEGLERFNEENTQRIVNQLKTADYQITHLDQLSKQYPANFQALAKDLEQFEQNFMSLRNQIEGSQKKTTLDLQKLEDQIEKLQSYKEKIQEDGLSQSQIGSSIINEELVEKIQEQKSIVEENIALLQESAAQVQEKLNKYQTQRNLYLHQYSMMQSEITQKDEQQSNSIHRSGRHNTSYQKKTNRMKDSFIKRSFISPEQNRSNFTNDDSYQ